MKHRNKTFFVMFAAGLVAILASPTAWSRPASRSGTSPETVVWALATDGLAYTTVETEEGEVGSYEEIDPSVGTIPAHSRITTLTVTDFVGVLSTCTRTFGFEIWAQDPADPDHRIGLASYVDNSLPGGLDDPPPSVDGGSGILLSDAPSRLYATARCGVPKFGFPGYELVDVPAFSVKITLRVEPLPGTPIRSL